MHNRFLHRREFRDLHSVALFEARYQCQGFGVQLAGFERRNGNAELMAGKQVGDHHVFGAQAGGLHDPPGVFHGSALKHGNGMRDAVVVPRRGARIKAHSVHIEAPSLMNSGCTSFASSSADPAGNPNRGRLSRASPW